MILNEKEIKKFEEMLIEQKGKLEEELGRIAKPTSDKGDYETVYEDIGDDREDNASEVEEYVDNVALENNLEEQLKEINRSLEKIKSDSFGVCEECGKEIAIERLEANPSAVKCMQCASK
ncbi:MAG: TraR/DksA C4-type zinc finger protein [Parcubacteria group bacterium]|jgi:RNA polymerase-binding protein DksA